MDRVTGAQRYAADIRLENMLHVKLVSLGGARARIDAIDQRDAERTEGVRSILTAAGLPQPVPRYGPAYADRPVLAVGETHFSGEPVAAVAAEIGRRGASWPAADSGRLRRAARRALDRLRRLDPAAPLVQDPRARRRTIPCAHTNVLEEWCFRVGRGGAGRRRLRRRKRLHVPHGDALRHRAARFSGRARCRTA